MSLSSFGVRRPVVANLVMLAIVGAGLILGAGLRREFFPEVRPNLVTIAAPYPGASPDEIEDSLAIKIEDRIADLRGVKEINTTIVDGAANLTIEFVDGYPIDDAVARVKREVDALQDLPERSERIIVEELEPKIPVITVTLFGDADERTMKDAAQRMREDLRSLPGMGTVAISGVRTDEISVEVDPDALLKHSVSLVEVSRKVTEAMAELPGGAVRTPSQNVAIRTLGAEEIAAEVRDIIVVASPEGRPVRLGEIARVTQGFEDVDIATRLNGQPAVSLTIYAEGDQDVVEIADLVRAYVVGRRGDGLRMNLPERLAFASDAENFPPRVQAYELGLSHEAKPPGEIALHNNISRFVSQRLELLSRNAFWGGVLVFCTLMLLLAPRVALWVTVGLIISLLGALAFMQIIGLTLNFLTMFGLIIVLGLLVDDAIVVAENIKSRHERGEPPLKAAINGAIQVEWPVVATVLTTIAAFMPLRLIEGQIGDFMGALPLVVICALSISLIESLLILPAHMGHSLEHADRRGKGRLDRLAQRIDERRTRFFNDFLAPRLAWVLERALRRRYRTVAIAISVLLGSLGMVAGGRVAFVFLQSADSETVFVNLQMPVGTPMAQTEEVVRRIEATAGELQPDEIQTVFSLVGSQQDPEGRGGVNQSHIGQVVLELVPVEARDRASDAIIDDLRARLGTLAGVKSLRFEEVQGGPAGPGITYTLVGENERRIEQAADAVMAALEDFEGVHSISVDVDRGQRELRLRLRPGAQELGFTTESVALQMRAAVFGIEAHTFAGEREDVDVRVKLDESSRRSLSAIESLYIFTPDGRPVPIGEVVEISDAEGYASIRRLDRRRAITVSADVYNSIVSPEQVTRELGATLRAIEADHPGVSVIPRGRQKEVADSFRTLPIGMLAAVGMIYLILAWLFHSYVQPLAVLMAVPFSMIGVVWGHWLLGFDMTILSLIGFVALTGIVVNDSLILMEFYNHKRREGLDAHDALIAAGRARIRAILLTTITTVLGLSPLMLEQSFQARFLIPMAITISFGLISATVLILVVLPCLVMIAADVKRIALWLWHGGRIPAGAMSAQTAAIDAALADD
ncbi:MAG: efflux RND transporter permease subunit [Phycisphaerales bacterium]